MREDGNYTGRFYRILSNTGDTLTLDNPLNENFGLIFGSSAMIEIFEASTLGSLFGYNSTVLTMGDPSVADYIFILKPPSEQNGSVFDYRSYYHDGNYWKEVNGSDLDVSETHFRIIIYYCRRSMLTQQWLLKNFDIR